MSNIRAVKFSSIITDINNQISPKKEKNRPLGFISGRETLEEYQKKCSSQKKLNYSLGLIYDYEKLNQYGKAIIEISEVNPYIHLDTPLTISSWNSQFNDISALNDEQVCFNAALSFAQYAENSKERFKFIFWALMVLTVDDSDYDAHLKLICDFIQMLHITNEQLDDILSVINVIYGKEDCDFIFNDCQTESLLYGVTQLFVDEEY